MSDLYDNQKNIEEIPYIRVKPRSTYDEHLKNNNNNEPQVFIPRGLTNSAKCKIKKHQ